VTASIETTDHQSHGRIVDFVVPVLGFPEDRTFELSPVDVKGLIYTLRSTNNPDLRFVVVPPGHFFPDYAPKINPDDVTELELGDDAEVQVLAIVSLKRSLADATANLLAPIVLSVDTGRAKQVVLSDADLPMRAPLLAADH
jgi:flagellar assembly factor FliW